MMNWLTQWKALSDRIAGIIEAGSLYYQTQIRSSEDSYSTVKKQLLPRFRRLFKELEDFVDRHDAALPPGARSVVADFLDSNRDLFTNLALAPEAVVKSALPTLAGFKAEFQYQIADLEVVAQRRVERAFQHLQRSIVADPEVRARWQAAFDDGETTCEGLGAAHLLLHGIWAFKVSGTGGRTDLVFQQPLDDLDEVQRSAEALVLTEWKKAPTAKLAPERARQGRTQAEAYSEGVLGGLELAYTRYVVVLSEDWVDLPDDESDGVLTYRYVGIAVRPSTPSRRAAR